VIRKAIKKWKLFPTDDSAKKVIYLAIRGSVKEMDNEAGRICLTPGSYTEIFTGSFCTLPHSAEAPFTCGIVVSS